MSQNSSITNQKTKLGKRVWASAIIFGLFGQIAWIIENMYFNVFMDRTVTSDPFAVQIMVALSAVFATAATLVAGTFSDRVGKRKQIISWGYLIWGITVMVFAFINVDNTSKIFGMQTNAAITMTVGLIVFMDCIMSIVGSSANDAAFNAWVTDTTDNTNRGIVEGVLAIMPILAMAVVFGALDWMTADKFLYLDGTEGSVFIDGAVKIGTGNWKLFFLLLGGLTSFVGILGFFLLKDKKGLEPNKKASFKEMFYGFKISVVKGNKELYLAFLAMAIIGIANMAYMPYLIMYAERTLGFANYIIPVAIIIVTSAIASVVLGAKYDKFGKQKFILPISCIYIVGAVLMVLASPVIFKNGTPMWSVALSGFLLMTGNLGLSAILTATVRDYTPKDKVGQFQGVRMFFWVLVPMVIGPLLTAIITKASEPVGKDFYGNDVFNYPPYMFAISACIMVLNMPLMLKIRKYLQKSGNITVKDN